MDNLELILTLALVVVVSSILLLFSQEFTRLIKKIMAMPGVKLLLPLLLASWLIEMYEEWGHWYLISYQAEFHAVSQKIAQIFPFQTASLHLVRILALFLLACLPVWIFWLQAKYKGIYTLPLFAYYLSAALWIVAVFLLVVM